MNSASSVSVPALLPEPVQPLLRLIAFATVFIAAGYVLNNFLIYKGGLARMLDGGGTAIAIYVLAIALAFLFTFWQRDLSLSQTADHLSTANTVIIRGAFWAVCLVGLVDAAISFLRVEDLAEPLFGEQLTKDLSRSNFRGPYIHLPIILLGFALAFVTRGLGFIWLALMVVLAQLTIVITINVYSYEHAFLSGLIRFWYAALFLFATAHTLLAGGHVRVDVVFANLKQYKKNWVNFLGSIFLGLPFAWVTLLAGTWDDKRTINAPLFGFEIDQQSVGALQIKYVMAGFLLVLAVTLIIQFVALMLSSVADQGNNDSEEVNA